MFLLVNRLCLCAYCHQATPNKPIDISRFEDYSISVMSTQIRISAKNLGELAMPSFCPKCFWLKLRLNSKLPFQIFPGIFSSIDSYTKKYINTYFDQNKKFPDWLNVLGKMKGYINPPHFTKFYIIDKDTNILLTGVPDGIYVKPDSSHIIVDYKTAKYTGNQDTLMPIYEIQLNVYALIGEKTVLHPVSGLALIYMEPATGEDAFSDKGNSRRDGFAMGFSANVHLLPITPEHIPPLLAKVREIFELQKAPDGCTGCKDCQLLEGLVNVITGKNTGNG
jgi:hypothetical protein